jgi:MFS family permease
MATHPVPSPAEPSSWRAGLRRIPRIIWALGLTSMFMDISSELVHSLLPVYMSSTLGASMLTIGLVEGIAEATASVTKVFSGVLSDYWNKRKPLVVLGYSLSAFTKPVFPLALSIGWVAAARFVDRIGKGIRDAPRDALVADVTCADIRGSAYGLRQALDSVGALLGPLLALAFMIILRNNVRGVLWIAAAPAFVAVILLFAGVREPERTASEPVKTVVFRDAKRLERGYWLIVTLGATFTLARFSEAFLILRAERTGLSIAYVPVVMVVMNAVYTAGAYPAGAASDRLSHRELLFGGVMVLMVADLILATATTILFVLVGAAVWGLHMALTQGLFSKLVADSAPPDLRGTAFGIFNLIAGVAALFASVIAGFLWNSLGPSATFFAGAAFAAAIGLGMGLQTALQSRPTS